MKILTKKQQKKILESTIKNSVIALRLLNELDRTGKLNMVSYTKYHTLIINTSLEVTKVVAGISDHHQLKEIIMSEKL